MVALFTADLLFLSLFLTLFLAYMAIKKKAEVEYIKADNLSKLFFKEKLNNNALLEQIKITKVMIFAVLFSFLLVFFPYPLSFTSLRQVFPEYNGLSNLKSMIYIVTLFAMWIKYQEDKDNLSHKSNDDFSNIFKPASLFAIGAFGAIISVSALDFIFLFGGIEVLSVVSLCFILPNREEKESDGDKNDEVDKVDTIDKAGSGYKETVSSRVVTNPAIETAIKPATNTGEATKQEELGSASFIAKVAYGASTLFFALGLFLLYKQTGYFHFQQVQEYFDSVYNFSVWEKVSLACSFILIVLAFCLKLGLVPFHFWVDKLFCAAGNSACCMFSCVFVPVLLFVLARLIGFSFHSTSIGSQAILTVLAFSSVIVPALSFLRTNNLKRFMANLTTMMAGFCLFVYPCLLYLPVVPILAIILFFLVSQSVSLIGIFGFLSASFDRKDGNNFDVLQGIGKSYPFYALSFLTFLFCLVGAPPFFSFLGKLGLAVILQNYGLYFSALGIIFATVLIFLYSFKLVSVVYKETSDNKYERFSSSFILFIVLVIALLVSCSIFSNEVFIFCQEAVKSAL